jgi:hypothetical protein
MWYWKRTCTNYEDKHSSSGSGSGSGSGLTGVAIWTLRLQ